MLRRLFILCSILLASQVQAQPKIIQTEYEVARDGKPFATVTEKFSQDGKQYRIESTTKGIGIYALFGERKLLSTGSITDSGLKPARFESHQSSNPSKTLVADFDWQNKVLSMQVKNKTKTASLLDHTQDLLSYAYQFAYLPPQDQTVEISLTTGKKLNHYTYIVEAETLRIGDKSYRTLHLSQNDQSESRQLWLAVDLHHIPVKILMTDEDGVKIEQTLSRYHME